MAEGTSYTLTVKTGDRERPMILEEDVIIRFFNKDDDCSHDIKIAISDLEIGKTKDFPYVIGNPTFGDPLYIELKREHKWLRHGRWLCDYVKLAKVNSDEVFMFPVNRCVLVGTSLRLKEYDTSLPQDDANSELRKAELKRKALSYAAYENKKTDMIMVRHLPYEEAFSFRYSWDIGTEVFKLLAKYEWLEWTTGKCETFEDIEKLYRPPLLPVPEGIEYWKSDKHFGNQRLTGVNPAMIRLCSEIPKNFAIDTKKMRHLLEGFGIEEAIAAKRLFIVNHEILKDVPSKEGKLCAPLALFFVNKKNNLMPIAIQLFQDPAADNPVFYPSDPMYTWIMAKCYFNLADASVHESISHLGFTHLIGEVFAIATNRCLSPSHPIYRLLAPHFLYLLAINKVGIERLIGPHGVVNIIMTIGSAGLTEIIKRKFSTWRLDVEGSLPADLENRGVASSSVLPNYHYRDDAMLIHGAISRYVRQIVDHFYDSPEKIAGDYELQDWGAFLGGQNTAGRYYKTTYYGDIAPQGGIQGLPNNGHFETAKEIADVVTSVIFICSASHAAVNFGQYDNYAFPPSYPGWMNGAPPKDKTALQAQDVIEKLPNKHKILLTMCFTKLLSMHDTKPLGDFEVQYLFDRVSLTALKEFRKDLTSIEEIINSRNGTREDKYYWLLPSNVPNSIAI